MPADESCSNEEVPRGERKTNERERPCSPYSNGSEKEGMRCSLKVCSHPNRNSGSDLGGGKTGKRERDVTAAADLSSTMKSCKLSRKVPSFSKSLQSY